MVHFTPVSVFFVFALLAVQGVGAQEAHALELFPELKGTGPVDVAYIDPDTHNAVHEKIDEHGHGSVQKRSYPVNHDALTKLLKNHNGYGFCKGFCPGYSPKPVTKTNLKTSTKVVTVMATKSPSPVTVIRTTTAKAPADISVTETIKVSTTLTTFIIVDNSTITSSAMITEVATETDVETETFTLSPTSAASTPVRRGARPPPWLKGFATNLICPACQKVWPKPSPKTVSVCKTTTKTTVQTRTVTKPVSTATSTVTITPAAKSVTVSLYSTITFTDVTISTTTTVCAQQTANVNGIAATLPGSLKEGGRVREPSDCCRACYNTSGCNLWAFFYTNFCFFSAGDSGLGTPTDSCPNGKGNGQLFTEGDFGAGGPGQCAL